MNATEGIPKPGEVVGEKYTVVRTIGVGGMGAVMEVTHRITGRHFALKWLLPNGASSHDGIKRFIREAQVAGRLTHGNVVEVYDIGQLGTSAFMVMELLRGENLHEHLARVGAMHPMDALDVLLPVMSGVAAAHAKSIVHRDLKPDNIFLSQAPPGSEHQMIPKVLDFGICKLFEGSEATLELTRNGTVVGTPKYMPPEQLRGEKVDPRADIYALGVILYEMLAGRLPHDAATFGDLVIKIATEEAPRLETLRPSIPVPLADVVHRAMAKGRDERYASVGELADALAPFGRLHLSTAGQGTPPLSTADPTGQQTPLAITTAAHPTGSSRPWRAPLAAVTVALAVGAATLSLVLVARDGTRSAINASTAPDEPAHSTTPGGGPPEAMDDGKATLEATRATRPTMIDLNLDEPARPQKATPARADTLPRGSLAPKVEPATAAPGKESSNGPATRPDTPTDKPLIEDRATPTPATSGFRQTRGRRFGRAARHTPARRTAPAASGAKRTDEGTDLKATTRARQARVPDLDIDDF